MILETKEQIIERLIKAGHISFSEALKLMETQKEYIPYNFPPYNPPYNPPTIQPYYDWQWYPGPTMTYCNTDFFNKQAPQQSNVKN